MYVRSAVKCQVKQSSSTNRILPMDTLQAQPALRRPKVAINSPHVLLFCICKTAWHHHHPPQQWYRTCHSNHLVILPSKKLKRKRNRNRNPTSSKPSYSPSLVPSHLPQRRETWFGQRRAVPSINHRAQKRKIMHKKKIKGSGFPPMLPKSLPDH